MLNWYPPFTTERRRALPADCPDLLARFCKETSKQKQEMLPDVDHMDIGVRQENLQVRGEPIMLQLCVVPAYALHLDPLMRWLLRIFELATTVRY